MYVPNYLDNSTKKDCLDKPRQSFQYYKIIV